MLNLPVEAGLAAHLKLAQVAQALCKQHLIKLRDHKMPVKTG